MHLIQVTPAFPPMISGVGDYSEILHQSLSEQILCQTLVTRPVPGLSGQRVIALSGQRSSSEIAAVLESADHVLLNFSGYGYAAYGLCQWLVDALRSWKQAQKERRLITLFHEVYATGPMWRSSFWSSRGQRRIAKDLAQLSDVVFVTSQAGHQQLTSICRHISAEILPVFSTIGELRDVLPLSERSPLAVVFGSSARRRYVYTSKPQQVNYLQHGLQKLGIREIIDIGPGVVAPDMYASLRVRRQGILSSSEISDLLADCRIGLVESTSLLIEKSSIASSYFSHGLLVVNTGNSNYIRYDLKANREFVGSSSIAAGCYDIQSIASAGFKWYNTHSISATTKRILGALELPSRE